MCVCMYVCMIVSVDFYFSGGDVDTVLLHVPDPAHRHD